MFGWTQKLFKLEKCLPKYAGFLLIFQKKTENNIWGKKSISNGGRGDLFVENIHPSSIDESGPHENLWAIVWPSCVSN